ncbi:MAG: sulfatase-like hydrolase/transferase [Caldilineales bacterium]|nr:sulfatase-like hydrolase/transferase [Caldilineales bacterium]
MQRKPNILIIMTDQQRADFLKGQGFALDTMPYLESLRERGCWFQRAYTPIPICMPARISMMTGRYAKAHGMIGNWQPLTPRYGQDLPGTLREDGYELALFGKNHTHLGPDDFDVWREYSHTEGLIRVGREAEDEAFNQWLTQVGHWVSHEPTPFPLECQYPVRIINDALEWLNLRNDNRPFFAWVSFPEPHSPYQVPEPYFSLFPTDAIPAPVAGPEILKNKNYQWQFQYRAIQHYHPESDHIWPRYRANYCGMLRLIDDQLRRLVEALEVKDGLENTIVLFLSDHGDFCGDYGLYRKGLALPECTIRVPMLWFGGAIQPNSGSHPAHVSISDVFPTLCEASGIAIPTGVQGRSLWPILTGQLYQQAEFSSVYSEIGIGGAALTEEDGIGFGEVADTFFVDGVARTNFDGTQVAMSGYRRAVVSEGWKLIYDPDLPTELYHLESDPAELTNLAGQLEYARIGERLLRELVYWSVRLDDNVQVRRYSPKVCMHNWRR